MKNQFIALFLKTLQGYLEKDLGESETENQMLIHASQICVEKLKHISESM